MRVHPLICILVISLSIVVFYYLTYRSEINSEFSMVTKVVKIDADRNVDDLFIQKDNEDDSWETLKITIKYSKEIGLLRTFNDKIINSKKFTFFLLEFLNRSLQAKNVILSQNNFGSKDFNSTTFLSTLFYTKYEQENHNNHSIVIKGRTKKAAKILQIAVSKALNKFYENSEDSILSISEVKLLKEKIELFENKSVELAARINSIKQNQNDNFATISVTSEINILEDELNHLQNTLEDIQSTNSIKLSEGLLTNEFLKDFGRIEEYVTLIQQLKRALNTNSNSPASEEIRSNKSKLTTLLLKEFDKSIAELTEKILTKQQRIIHLTQKSIKSSSPLSSHVSIIPEISLYDKVNASLQKLKKEYYEKVKFWNDSKEFLTFHSD